LTFHNQIILQNKVVFYKKNPYFHMSHHNEMIEAK